MFVSSEKRINATQRPEKQALPLYLHIVGRRAQWEQMRRRATAAAVRAVVGNFVGTAFVEVETAALALESLSHETEQPVAFLIESKQREQKFFTVVRNSRYERRLVCRRRGRVGDTTTTGCTTTATHDEERMK